MSTFPRDPARKTFAEFLARPPDEHGQVFEVPDDFHRRLYTDATRLPPQRLQMQQKLIRIDG